MSVRYPRSLVTIVNFVRLGEGNNHRNWDTNPRMLHRVLLGQAGSDGGISVLSVYKVPAE